MFSASYRASINVKRQALLLPLSKHSLFRPPGYRELSMSSFGNESDHIRDVLRWRHLTKWGFVIYRCTSRADDIAWQSFMSVLRQRAHIYLEQQNGLDLKESLQWTVLEDHQGLAGASISHVKVKFREWLATEGKSEQDQAAAEAEQARPLAAANGLLEARNLAQFPTRYFYCIHVDDASLDSVVNRATHLPTPDLETVGYVNIVDGGPDPPEDPDDPPNDEEEGDQSWMRISADGLIPSVYSRLQSSGAWYALWVMPPGISKG